MASRSVRNLLARVSWEKCKTLVSRSRRDRIRRLESALLKKSSFPRQKSVRSSRRMDFKEIAADVEAAGQSQLLEDWESLVQAEQQELLESIKNQNLAQLNEIFQKSMESQDAPRLQLHPARDVLQLKHLNNETAVDQWKHTGMDLIRQGKVGVLILAGGQGTRLGSAKPKGCYDVGLPSKKSLFQLHCERIRRIQTLAQISDSDEQPKKSIRLYIMTSIHTHKETVDFFNTQQNFGLDSGQVHFFQQGMMPCLTEDGKIILETSSKVALSPNGNGGVYSALNDSGCLADMIVHGVECVDCFSVDNLLAKPADPLFLGYCWTSGAPCGARVVAKAFPEEKVGVFVQCNDRCQVVEYSELSAEMSNSREGDDGALLFNWGNICMHYFKTDLLQRMATETTLPYHIARKAIPSKGNSIQGIKLEQFIFDAFPLSSSVALMEVRREEQFAAVKNAPGSATDSPDTACKALMQLHKRWIEDAGGEVHGTCTVEVSPLLSYEGEGLKDLCNNITFQSPNCIHLNSDTAHGSSDDAGNR